MSRKYEITLTVTFDYDGYEDDMTGEEVAEKELSLFATGLPELFMAEWNIGDWNPPVEMVTASKPVAVKKGSR